MQNAVSFLKTSSHDQVRVYRLIMSGLIEDKMFRLQARTSNYLCVRVACGLYTYPDSGPDTSMMGRLRLKTGRYPRHPTLCCQTCMQWRAPATSSAALEEDV